VKHLALLSYGHNQLVLPQAAELARRFANYQAVVPVYLKPATARRLSRWFPSLTGPLARRTHPAIDPSRVCSYPRELLYQFAARLARRPFSYFASHDRMAARITRDFAPPRMVVAVDTGAEALFRAWSGKTLQVLDLTIATPQYREKIYRAAEADPENLGIKFHYPGEWELRRAAAELTLADAILCPSQFVVDSCLDGGVPPAKLHLLPYGFDLSDMPKVAPAPFSGTGLQMVFAGTFCHRKGSHLLLQAFARYRTRDPQAVLHVFGRIIDEPATWPEGVIRHGHVPLSTLTGHLQRMHLMVFPTFFEGSSLVVYQALALGLPVITTNNCGSVVDESCGQILSEVSARAVESALETVRLEPARLTAWRQGAAVRANGFTWTAYGDHLAAILRRLDPALA
jgi:glycosyltransferase involved in cell wall biosynthesis